MLVDIVNAVAPLNRLTEGRTGQDKVKHLRGCSRGVPDPIRGV